jgi:hypothetical protein
VKKQYLLIAATAVVALIAGTRAARYLQLQRERPPVTVDTSIGEVRFGSNHGFQPKHLMRRTGNAIFVYLPTGYGFGQNDEHNEYVLRLSLALLCTTNGRFRMEPVPHITEGGNPNASAIISAGSNYAAWSRNKAGKEPQTWAGTPLAYQYYMGDDPAPDFDKMVELVTFLIEHPGYVEQAYRKIASLFVTVNQAK